MICSKCGAQQPDNGMFCASCGSRLMEVQENNYQNPQMNQPVNVPVNPPVYAAPPVPVRETTEPVTSIGQYILWWLIGLIPLVGFILTIVFAADSSKKNRANFFRAQLIIMAICLFLSIFMVIMTAVTGAAILGGVEEFADILSDIEYYL